MTRPSPKLAGKVKGGSPTGGKARRYFAKRSQLQGSDCFLARVARPPLEVHHVVKRAQGGSDFDLDRLVALCPPCMPRRMPPTRGAA